MESVRFEGDAPTDYTGDPEECNRVEYYHEGAEGFTHPVWNGYKTEIR